MKENNRLNKNNIKEKKRELPNNGINY